MVKDPASVCAANLNLENSNSTAISASDTIAKITAERIIPRFAAKVTKKNSSGNFLVLYKKYNNGGLQGVGGMNTSASTIFSISDKKLMKNC